MGFANYDYGTIWTFFIYKIYFNIHLVFPKNKSFQGLKVEIVRKLAIRKC